MFRDLKIRYKILLIALVATLSYLCIWVTVQLLGEKSSLLMYEIETEYQPSLEMSRDLEVCLIQIDHAFKDAVSKSNPGALQKADSLRNRFDRSLEDIRYFAREERVDQLHRSFEAYYRLAFRNTMQHLSTGKLDERAVAGPDSVQLRFEQVKAELNFYIQQDRQKVATSFESARQNQATSLEVITWVTVLCIISLGILSLLIARSFTRPLEEVVQVAKKFARGNRHVKVSVDGSDEVGVLAETFNKMVEDIQKITVSRDYVDNIFRSLNDALFVILPDGKIETVNTAACEMLGYTQAELQGMSIRDVLLDPEFDVVNLLKLTHSISNVEQEYCSRTGSRIPVLFSAAIMDSEADESKAVCAARDMTDLVKTKEAMYESELRFRNIVESSPMGLFMFELYDDDYLVLAGSNPAARVLLGDNNSLLPGQRIEDAFKVLNDERLFAHYRRVAKDGVASHEEYEIVLDNGEARYFDIHAFQTSPGKLVAAFLDITQRKNAQKEKNLLEGQLRQSQKMQAIGTLAGGIAHDFNNILWIIMGNAELALRRIDNDDAVHSKLKEIVVASRRAKNLIEKILTFSRRNEFELKAIKIEEVVTEALNLLEATLPSTIHVRRHIEDCGTLIADPTQIHQMVVNLCTNSYQAIGEQQGTLDVTTRLTTLSQKNLISYPDLTPGDFVEIVVADNGCGMDKDTLERIFDPFFTTKEVGQGTGLGLATVHGIVSDMGGAVKVDSEIGQGSRFKILLPANDVFQEPEIVLPVLPQVEVVVEGQRIMVVDDEEQVRTMLKEMLGELGHISSIYSNGRDALEAFRNAPEAYDLIITDQSMPEMSGVELSAEVYKIRPDLPVILASGFSKPDGEDKIKHSKMREYLKKPIILHDLRNVISQVIDNPECNKEC